MSAAKNGQTAKIRNLLDSRAEIQAQDEHGQTALHYAVKHSEAQSAACLLAHGADYTIADNRGNKPTSLEYAGMESLHAIKQHYRRYRKQDLQPSSERVRQWQNELEINGVLRIPGFVATDDLADLHREFEEFVQRLERKTALGAGMYRHYDEEDHYWVKEKTYLTNNAFKNSPTLAKICSQPEIQELANHFYGERAFIARGTAMRYLPTEPTTVHMYGWHHDMEDRRFKMMILLTDLGAKDQCMSYALGTHKIFHPVNMFYTNRCSLEYCEKKQGSVEIFNASGNAGDIIIFDSNGAHRGNRRPDTNTRDAYFIEYDTEIDNVWGGDIPDAGDNEHQDASYQQLFSKMTSVAKRWDIPRSRKHPLWIENLPHIERWL